MQYKLGVAVLLDDATSNQIRLLELEVASATSNAYGLRQPPHITVKRPFEVSSHAEAAAFSEDVRSIARVTSTFTLAISGSGDFGGKVVYLPVATEDDSAQLRALPETLLETAAHYNASIDEYEATGRPTFHATIAMGLDDQQHTAALDIVRNAAFSATTVANRLAVLISVDDGQNWSVFQTFTLGSTKR
jgi:2'-5' RNA ligase